MRVNNLYLDRALEILAERRGENQRLYESRRAEIISKLPEYEEAEAELTRLMNKVMGLSEHGDGTPYNADDDLAESRRLNAKMTVALEKGGYPADHLSGIFTCPICRDTGSAGGEWCECVCRLTNQMAAKELNDSAPLEKSSFDNFELGRYSDESDGDNASPRKIMRENYEYCKSCADSFNGSGRGILMLGGTGLGKTHLSLAIARVLVDKGFCVVYGSVPELIRRIQNEQFGKAEGDTLSLVTGCDLLILDDLGAENSTEWCVSMLYEIINTRRIRDLPMIISSNLDLGDLGAVYGDRLSSRMFSLKIMFFAGEDNRIWASENVCGN